MMPLPALALVSVGLVAVLVVGCDAGPGPVVPDDATMVFSVVAGEPSGDAHNVRIFGTEGQVWLKGHYTTSPCVDLTASLRSGVPGWIGVDIALEPWGGGCIAVVVQHHFEAAVSGLAPGRYEVIVTVRHGADADTVGVASARVY